MTAPLRQTFLEQYAIIRHAEGRGSDDASYYRALPYCDLTGHNRDRWRIRARTFDYFVRQVLVPMESAAGRPLDLLDLGAGNGWLSWRLAQRGHRVTPVDIFIDDRDGLGALRKYAPITPVGADFNQLPFPSRRFDAAIYNASLHYSADYARTLKEALRVLQPSGEIVILDSPVYSRAGDGERMRAERQAFFERTYGFRSEALASIEYLDRRMLARLAQDLGIRWTLLSPWYGLRWAMRPLLARLRTRRPPSKFLVIRGAA